MWQIPDPDQYTTINNINWYKFEQIYKPEKKISHLDKAHRYFPGSTFD